MAKPAAAASVAPKVANPMAAVASFGGTFDLVKSMADTVTKIAKKTRT